MFRAVAVLTLSLSAMAATAVAGQSVGSDPAATRGDSPPQGRTFDPHKVLPRTQCDGGIAPIGGRNCQRNADLNSAFEVGTVALNPRDGGTDFVSATIGVESGSPVGSPSTATAFAYLGRRRITSAAITVDGDSESVLPLQMVVKPRVRGRMSIYVVPSYESTSVGKLTVTSITLVTIDGS